MKKANTELKLTIFNTPYERETSVMSRAQCLKTGETKMATFPRLSRSLYIRGVYDSVS